MTADPPCFERLQVIRDNVPHGGALNMALDEMLLIDSADAPVLRFYRWAHPTVSFGYFEPVAAARRVADGRELVRRQTGGGIVEHGDDLTYTLIVPRTDAFTHLRSADSYRTVHAAVARAMARCGLVSQTHGDPQSEPVNRDRPNACFERPVLHDLIADGRKVAGGAQRRNRVGLMHQGSIRPGLAAGGPGQHWKDGLRRELPIILARSCEERTHTPDELARAEMLAAAKYATPAWTNRV